MKYIVNLSQIMDVAVAALFFLCLYLGPPFLLFRAAYRSKKVDIKVITTLAGLVILIGPVWDIPITTYRFNKLCEDEGGIFVYKRVGLDQEFFLRAGELTKKLVERTDGVRTTQNVKANGNELIIDRLHEHYEILDESDYDATDWAGTVKFTTTVSDDEVTLGRAVSFVGGEGWFLRKINLGPRLPGKRCPVYKWETDRQSTRDRLLYEIFFKR